MQTAINLDDLRALLTPDRISEREGRPFLSPETTEEIAAIARYANRNSLAIEITGASTKRTWGNPVAADLLLDTTRLNRVLEHPWQDLTCTVQAGCTWSEMQQALARHNQFVALDPLWPDRATVGGIVATNDSGALRHRYGSLRDLIIGMTIVLADGTIAKSGGKVVKNVAGYDLHKLMTGAFGTLGIITEVTFRLHPLPLYTENFTVSAPQAGQLGPLMALIRDSHLLTQALQLRGDFDGFHLDIQLSAHPDAKQSTLLKAMVNDAGHELIDTGDHVWRVREEICGRTDRLVIKASMLPDRVAPSAQEVEEKDGQSVTQSIGVMYAAFPDANQTDYALAEEFRYHVGLDLGTTFVVNQNTAASACERWAYIAEGETPNSLPLMREIKRQFDPNRLLNPGRFLGGI